MKEKGGDIRTPVFLLSECKGRGFLLREGDKGEIEPAMESLGTEARGEEVFTLYSCYLLKLKRYSWHVKFFLGEKSLKSTVQNIIRLLHHPAKSFCHCGIIWLGFIGSLYGCA